MKLSKRRMNRQFLLATPAALVFTALCSGQCDPEWDTTMGNPGIGEGYVADFQVYDSGRSEKLFVLGSFGIPVGSWDGHIATWNGEDWDPVGGSLDNWATDMAVYDGELYVGGYFNSAGGVSGTDKLAEWNGADWSGIGAQLESWQSAVWSLITFDDGTGEALYIGGNYLNIAGTGTNHLAKWDGESFSAVGGAVAHPIPLVKCFQVYDGSLHVGGRIQTIGGVTVNGVAKWNGTDWEALGTGLAGSGYGVGAHAMAVWDDGTGEALYVGGHSFTSAGGVPATRIAKWDGEQWYALGDGFDGTVESLAVYDDGNGEALYAFGAFTHSGATSFNYIAKWNGSAWSTVGAGANDTIFAGYIYNDGVQDTLCVGGSFTTIDGMTSKQVAQYVGCPSGIPADVNGDGVVDVLDLLAVLSVWGPCPDCVEDINDDGVVDVLDLLEVLSNWS